jgi:hypothetical protein
MNAEVIVLGRPGLRRREGIAAPQLADLVGAPILLAAERRATQAPQADNARHRDRHAGCR